MPERETFVNPQEREPPPQEQREKIFKSIIVPMLFPELTGGDPKLSAHFLRSLRPLFQHYGIPDVQMEYVLGNTLLRRGESMDDLERNLKGMVHSIHLAIPRAEMEPNPASVLKHHLTFPFSPLKGRLNEGLEATQRVEAKVVVMHAAELVYPFSDKKEPERYIPGLLELMADERDKIAPDAMLCVETQGKEVAQLPRERCGYVYNPLALARMVSPWQKRNIGLTIDFQHILMHELDPVQIIKDIHKQYPGLIKHVHINASPSISQDAHQSIAEMEEPTKSQLQQFLFALAEMEYEGKIVPEVDPLGTIGTHVKNLFRRKIIDPARGTPYHERAQNLDPEIKHLQDNIENIRSLLVLKTSGR